MSTQSIPKTQKALVFHQHNGPIAVENEWPVTQPKDLKPGEVLVSVKYTGVCHTDLHAWHGDWPLANKVPLVGGHEGAGHVVAIGENTTTQLKIGDAVGIKWLADSCLNCEECRKGFESSCSHSQNSGFTVDGSFQQYAVSYANHLTPIPKGFPLDAAAPILCAGVTVYKALKETGITAGETVVIPGAGGGLGHLACQYARVMGFRIIGVDHGEQKKSLLASYGVKDFIDFKEPGSVIDKIKDLTGGHGAHAAVVVASGAQAYEEALKYLRPHGTLVCVGMPPADMKVNVFNTVVNSLRVVGSYVGNRQDAIEALDIAARGDVHTSFVVDDLDKLPEVFEKMEKGTLAGRVVLKCQ